MRLVLEERTWEGEQFLQSIKECSPECELSIRKKKSCLVLWKIGLVTFQSGLTYCLGQWLSALATH